MGTSADALQREVQELREENAALLEAVSTQGPVCCTCITSYCTTAELHSSPPATGWSACMPATLAILYRESSECVRECVRFAVLQLRLAQRGDVDLRGHLSKWNPDASAQGIFTQDWELRYFVLSGQYQILIGLTGGVVESGTSNRIIMRLAYWQLVQLGAVTRECNLP